MSKRFTRRTFLALTGATAVHTALHAVPVKPAKASAGAVSLAGEWSFALDRADEGVSAAWFRRKLPVTTSIQLPGILQTQGYGNEITAETKFVAALPRDMRWYLLPQYKAYTRPGHVEVPYLSQPVRHYLGVAWYQREMEIPAAWRGKRVELKLERTRWETTVYVDERKVGSCRSLVSSHNYDLGILEPGKHRLTIRINNSMLLPPYRPDGHSVSDAEGSTWNGVVGRIELRATTPVWIDDAQVYPNLQEKHALIKVKVGNLTAKAGSGTVRAGGVSAPVQWTADGGEAELEVPMNNATPWSEFTPVLQHLRLTLTGPQADDRRELRFGMREIRVEGKHILLNGELFQFRATHDGGGFPLTGYPATDVATWKRIIGICKQWGLNGIRFHSWCPPEAAFTAADELGFYLQPECGMWNSFDPEGKMLQVLRDETTQLLKQLGNHPSLVLLNASNEPAGHYREQLPGWDTWCRQNDSRRLYSDGTGRFAPAPAGPGTPFAANYLVLPARGPRGWFGGDYELMLAAFVRGSVVPCIGHEVGQWCAYPDFSVIEKFSGKQKQYAAFVDGIGSGKVPYMHPGNYIIWRDSARKHGLLAQNKELAHASGRFQIACYKEEIEANLRTPSYSGYELLDLHDYLGQGGALIGMVDAFWESKEYVTPVEFRQFNNTTVPLARFRDRVIAQDQPFEVEVELAHFGPHPLASVTPEWQIVDTANKVAASGTLPSRPAPRGKNLPLGTVKVDLNKLHAPAAYKLVVELRGTEFRNEWPFWLYPNKVTASVPEGVIVTASWEEAKAALDKGGKVLFLSGDPETPTAELALTSVPIFWNRLMNPHRTWMLGLWCDTAHGALVGFPTQAHCDWQWVDLLPKTTAMHIDGLPHTLRPLVQPIDDWNRNLRLAMLFECKVGKGRLMMTSFHLDDQGMAGHPGAPSLRRSLLKYMGSPAFSPSTEIALADLEAWVPQRYTAPVTLVNPPSTKDLVDPGQIRHLPT